jgi:lactam utilization protein B
VLASRSRCAVPPQHLEDLGLAGGAAFLGHVLDTPPPTIGGRLNHVRPPLPEAALAAATAADRPVAEALLAGAVIVDELVAVTGLAVGAVLGALTRLEAAGLVVGSHGRYRPDGVLASRSPGPVGVPA